MKVLTIEIPVGASADEAIKRVLSAVITEAADLVRAEFNSFVIEAKRGTTREDIIRAWDAHRFKVARENVERRREERRRLSLYPQMLAAMKFADEAWRIGTSHDAIKAYDNLRHVIDLCEKAQPEEATNETGDDGF